MTTKDDRNILPVFPEWNQSQDIVRRNDLEKAIHDLSSSADFEAERHRRAVVAALDEVRDLLKTKSSHNEVVGLANRLDAVESAVRNLAVKDSGQRNSINVLMEEMSALKKDNDDIRDLLQLLINKPPAKSHSDNPAVEDALRLLEAIKGIKS